MINSDFSNKLTGKAFNNFEKIKTSLKGLFEILQLTLDREEDDMYYNMGVDNISGLYENLIELFPAILLLF